MADPAGLRVIGFAFSTITAAVLFVAVTIVATHGG